MIFDKITDARVTYSGDSIPELGIEKGKQYDSVITALAHGVQQLAKENDVDMSCISGACDKSVPIQRAVEVLRDRLCDMNIDTAKTTANLFGITSSPAAASLPVSTARYDLKLQGSNANLTWNMNDIVTNLPSGYTVLGSTVNVYGSGQNNNLVGNSSQTSGSVNIPTGSFPASAVMTLRVGTPQGSVDLTRTLPITSPTNNAGSVQLYPTGGVGGGTEMTQKQYNETLAAAIANQQKIIESLTQRLDESTSI
jgi:hypothetical protein